MCTPDPHNAGQRRDVGQALRRICLCALACPHIGLDQGQRKDSDRRLAWQFRGIATCLHKAVARLPAKVRNQAGAPGRQPRPSNRRGQAPRLPGACGGWGNGRVPTAPSARTAGAPNRKLGRPTRSRLARSRCRRGRGRRPTGQTRPLRCRSDSPRAQRRWRRGPGRGHGRAHRRAPSGPPGPGHAAPSAPATDRRSDAPSGWQRAAPRPRATIASVFRPSSARASPPLQPWRVRPKKPPAPANPRARRPVPARPQGSDPVRRRGQILRWRRGGARACQRRSPRQ